MYFIPFHPDHMLALQFADEQAFLQPIVANPEYRRAYYHPNVLSMSVVEGPDILCCYGVVPLWSGRGWAWAMFDRDIGPSRFVTVSKQARREVKHLMDSGFYRLEATVKVGYTAGERWAKHLGFEFEGVHRLLDNVNDYSMYAKVRA